MSLFSSLLEEKEVQVQIIEDKEKKKIQIEEIIQIKQEKIIKKKVDF